MQALEQQVNQERDRADALARELTSLRAELDAAQNAGGTVIDATTGGNAARWINHNCDGNCESEIEKSRVFIDATRDIPTDAVTGKRTLAVRLGDANTRRFYLLLMSGFAGGEMPAGTDELPAGSIRSSDQTSTGLIRRSRKPCPRVGRRVLTCL